VLCQHKRTAEPIPKLVRKSHSVAAFGVRKISPPFIQQYGSVTLAAPHVYAYLNSFSFSFKTPHVSADVAAFSKRNIMRINLIALYVNVEHPKETHHAG